MRAYEKLLEDKFATPNEYVFKLKPGENIIFESGSVRRGEPVKTRKVLVHGLGVGDVGKVVLGERAILGTEGIAVAVIKVRGGQRIDGVNIISRGFVFEKFSYELLNDAEKRLKSRLEKKRIFDKKSIHSEALWYLEDFFYQKTGRHPMVLPVVVEI
jgi:ribonuclease J